MIHQGEKYSLPFTITDSAGTVVTSSTCSDVRIKIGNTMKVYSESELTYDSSTKSWLYPLTEYDTAAMDTKVPYEVSVKFSDGTIIKSSIGWIDIEESIIKEVWTIG